MPCGNVSRFKAGLISINSALTERRKLGSKKFPDQAFLEAARTYQDDPDYVRITTQNYGIIRKSLDQERTINLAKLSLSFEEQYGTIHGSNPKLKYALSEEMHVILESIKEEVASGKMRSHSIKIENQDIGCMIHIQVQSCSVAMKFPWKRIKTGLVILMSVFPTYHRGFEKEQKNQRLFCCVRWMSSEMGSYKFLWGEDLKLKRKRGTKRFLKRVVREKGNRELEDVEELKPLLI